MQDVHLSFKTHKSMLYFKSKEDKITSGLFFVLKVLCNFSPISEPVISSGIMMSVSCGHVHCCKNQERAPHLRFSEGERQRSFINSVMEVSVDALQRGMEAGRVGVHE